MESELEDRPLWTEQVWDADVTGEGHVLRARFVADSEASAAEER